MKTLATNVAVLLVLAGGCQSWTPAGPPINPPPAVRGEELRVGLGWSNAADPAEAARQALSAAVKPLRPSVPDLVLVWDNWVSQQDARDAMAAMSAAHQASGGQPKVIFGGHVAWPVAARWSSEPSVLVLALGGGWSVRSGHYQGVAGLERDAAITLADALNVTAQAFPAGATPTPAASSQPAGLPGSPGQPGQPGQPTGHLIVLFGDLSGRRASRLVGELARRVDRGSVVFGGGGSGQGGSGWQYVAGQVVTDSVWAVRLAGPFRASAVRLAAQADSQAIDEAGSMGVTILRGDVGLANTFDHRPSSIGLPDLGPASTQPAEGKSASPGSQAPWRLLLMTPTAGWLACLKEPEQLVVRAMDRLGAAPSAASRLGLPSPTPVFVAGWAGDCQIAPDTKEQALTVGQFDLAMALIVPIAASPAAGCPAAPASTQPAPVTGPGKND